MKWKTFFKRFMIYWQTDIDRSETRAINQPANSKQNKISRNERNLLLT